MQTWNGEEDFAMYYNVFVPWRRRRSGGDLWERGGGLVPSVCLGIQYRFPDGKLLHYKTDDREDADAAEREEAGAVESGEAGAVGRGS